MAGYWTYHETHQACCGPCVPGCTLMLLTVPLWPLFGGVMYIKDKLTPPQMIEEQVVATSVNIDESVFNNKTL